MTNYELYHLIGRCIGVGFFLFMAILVICAAISNAPNEDGEAK